VDVTDYLARPDQHLDPLVAARYDAGDADRFGDAAVDAAVSVLAELAGDGVAVEFAVGTGRIALPLAAAGVDVVGIDISEPMIDVLRAKPGADRMAVTIGDMTETRVHSDASLVYLVYNTIGNLRSQRRQVACFRNAAAHLRPGGRFLIETGVPRLRRLAPGESILPFDVSTHHLGFDEYIDLVGQILISHHYFVEDGRARTVAGAFRYVWPSELDLMAELAGMRLEHRWSGWDRGEFTGDSESHVSVWRLPQ
jgi:SAM-dependent methyltransferase